MSDLVHQLLVDARVIAVADSFKAMTSDRPYRKALSVDQSIQILQEGRTKQWYPGLVYVEMIIHQVDEMLIDCVFKQSGASATSQTLLISS